MGVMAMEVSRAVVQHTVHHLHHHHTNNSIHHLTYTLLYQYCLQPQSKTTMVLVQLLLHLALADTCLRTHKLIDQWVTTCLMVNSNHMLMDWSLMAFQCIKKPARSWTMKMKMKRKKRKSLMMKVLLSTDTILKTLLDTEL